MKSLQSEVRGEVLEPAPAAYHRDFGGVHTVVPRAVVRPLDGDDVAAVVRFAARSGQRVVARGHGCSSDGQSLTDNIALDLKSLRGVTLFSEDPEHYYAAAGTPWGTVQETLWAQDRCVRVLTDNAAATVGGTLSVGGFGSTSRKLGAQIEQVVSLDVVTGAGERKTITRDGEDRALFEYTLAGLGQTAIIVGAKMRSRPRPQGTLLSRTILPGNTTLSSITTQLLADTVNEHCFLSKVIARNKWQVVSGRDMALSAEIPAVPTGSLWLERYHDQRFALTEMYVPGLAAAQLQAGLIKSADEVCNLWSDFMVPHDAADALWEAVAPLCEEPNFTQGPLGTVLERRTDIDELPLIPLPHAPQIVSLGVYCALPPTQVATYEKRYHAAAEKCVELGGRVYLYGCHPRRLDFYERQLGKQTLAAWRDVKRRYDPQDVLGQGWLTR